MQIIDGFTFENEEMIAQAKKEEEGVRYIKERTPLDNPAVVYNLYNKLLEQNLFSTPVGIRFLIELQNMLYAAESIPNENVKQIPTTGFVKEVAVRQTIAEPAERKSKSKAKAEKKNDSFYKKAYYVSLFFAIVFAICVAGMFIITKLSDNNVNIINYRNEIINEYAEWEASLKEKETSLKEWEKELEEKEAELEE